MVFGNGVKNIQAAAYNGARMVYNLKININRTSLDNWMISGKKLTRNFKVPRATSRVLWLSMAKIRPETPKFRC